MNALSTLFSDGGPWCVAIFLMGLLLYTGIAYQFRQGRRRDITPMLWAGITALVLFGLLASALGQWHAFTSAQVIERLDLPLFAQVVAVSLSTTILATAMAVVGAIAIGIVSQRSRPARSGASGLSGS